MGPSNILFSIQCLSSHPAISEKSIRFPTSFTYRKEELTVLSFFLLNVRLAATSPSFSGGNPDWTLIPSLSLFSTLGFQKGSTTVDR